MVCEGSRVYFWPAGLAGHFFCISFFVIICTFVVGTSRPGSLVDGVGRVREDPRSFARLRPRRVSGYKDTSARPRWCTDTDKTGPAMRGPPNLRSEPWCVFWGFGVAGLCSLAVGALLPASRDKARAAPGDSDLSIFGRAGRRSPTDGSDGGTDGDRRDASSSCGPHAPSSSSTPAQTRLAGCEAGPLQALASNAAPAAPAAAADLRVCSWRRRRRRRSRPLIDQPHADLGLSGEA